MNKMRKKMLTYVDKLVTFINNCDILKSLETKFADVLYDKKSCMTS